MLQPSMRRGCLIVTCLLALLAAGAGGSVPSRSSLLKQRSTLASRTARTRGKLQAIKAQQRRVTQDLQVVEGKVRHSRAALQEAIACLGATQSQLVTATKALQVAKRKLSAQESALADRLRFIYQHGEMGYFSVLTRAANFDDFADRYYLLRQVVDQDARLLAEVRHSKQVVSAKRSAVAAREREVRDWRNTVSSRHAQYVGARMDKARTLASLAAERRRYEAELAATEASKRRIDDMIRSLSRTAGGRRRYLTPWRGSFGNPVPGARITSGYGYRYHPIYHVRAFHSGVDLAAPMGTPIHAAGNGEVIIATSGGTGYGRFIVIDHGGGTTTLYGHCSRFAAGVGRKVQKGDVIAYVGSTGASTGPHCHFEVRRNGKTVSPM